MSQHDYVLDNNPGASVRSDINSAFGAIATLNSGATEPSTTYAYQLWADTGNGCLKQRNAANSAWVTLWELGTSFSLASPVIDREFGAYTTNADLTTQIPLDDTVPQNTEGTQIISVSFTPKSTTNRVRLRFQGQMVADVAGQAVAAAIFSSASASALKAGFVNAPTASAVHMLLEHEYVPGTTSALTFSVRVGPSGSAANVRLNGGSVGRLYGGTMGATLVIEEIAA